MRRPRHVLEAALLALIQVAGASAAAQDPPRAEVVAEKPPLALMGTIPIYWGEAARVEDLIGGAASPHWARGMLERHFTLVPLDYLAPEVLVGQTRLLLAQPRGLTAQENVALDAWVRSGGHLLLFADPMMTGASRFAIGDRRRPQDVALLSPILAHWGLELQYDEAQQPGVTMREIAGAALPVNLAGRFVADPAGVCRIESEAILARCPIGSGEILVLADAALLDLAGPWDGAADALETLVTMAYGETGENTGSAMPSQEIAEP